MKHVMAPRHYTIGQISRITRVSVRRLRFYADQGILPPSDRTESGYRLFADEDIVRIDLIKAMRGTGLGLQAIADLLAQKLSLQQVLALRLKEVEAQLTAQLRVASALKAALLSTDVSNEDLRRVWIMTNLSQLERSNAVAHFFAQVTDNSGVDPKWGDWMVRMSTPKMPDDPTSEQLDAWLEFSNLMADAVFLRRMRENGRDASLSMNFDLFKTVQQRISARALAALADGVDPASELGQTIAEEYLSGWAISTGSKADAAFYSQMRRKHLQHRPQMKRYWELVGVLGGLAGRSEPTEEWLWIEAAAVHRLRKVAA
jgi:DNA-binding transcriptional MerR regulator